MWNSIALRTEKVIWKPGWETCLEIESTLQKNFTKWRRERDKERGKEERRERGGEGEIII